jgi:hypothetical protein
MVSLGRDPAHAAPARQNAIRHVTATSRARCFNGNLVRMGRPLGTKIQHKLSVSAADAIKPSNKGLQVVQNRPDIAGLFGGGCSLSLLPIGFQLPAFREENREFRKFWTACPN